MIDKKGFARSGAGLCQPLLVGQHVYET
jgi:hypothetical protein